MQTGVVDTWWLPRPESQRNLQKGPAMFMHLLNMLTQRVNVTASDVHEETSWMWVLDRCKPQLGV